MEPLKILYEDAHLVIVFILWLKLGRRSRRYGSRGGKRRQRRAYRGRRRW